MSTGAADPALAGRMAGIEPFRVMEILARARQLEAEGRAIVHMEIGEPDFDTPPAVIEAAQKALGEARMHYTPALGLPALREAIARFYGERYGVALDPARVIVTAGASGALLLALGVLLDPGRAVLLADPGYPCNRHFVRFLGGRPLAVPVDAATGYQLTPGLAERHWTPDTAALLLATPANPTGTLVSSAALAEMARAVRQRGGRLIVDEIYHGLVYQGRPETALALTDQAFVVNSFSKYFNMTGWRLGWLVAPEAFVPAVERLAQNLFLAPSTPAQHAALAAFAPDTLALLEARKEEFRRRRDFLLPALRDLGFDIPLIPQGAFYLYAGCGRFTRDSQAFCRELLEQAGVAITPGADFGDHAPAQHVRFAYTTALDQLEKGVRRIAAFLDARRGRD